MDILTIILFVVALSIYVISIILKRDGVKWLSFFMSICAIAQIVVDETVANPQNILLIAPLFYVMLISGLDVMMTRRQ